ncbi:mechanosensitive ion channel [Carboxylicivirga sp. A043]|uniref:mechanosensitive ion channel family protein n=1 Tax=Carboxylicivirga litoralis TaxID=2816963 RepID=UPI0021CB3E9B|nr:mechanosensitive ion channel family protein [Carboxylicivirga sp. A043]MCU4155500.1 mechanosensitive ion channel [Carboxylicivirga sp. A043]
MKKLVPFLLPILFTFSVTLPANTKPDSIFNTLLKDSVVTNITTELTNDSVQSNNLKDRIHQLGAPAVDKIITPGKIAWSAILILFGFIILKIIELILNRMGKRSSQATITVKRINPIIKILGWIFVTYIIIQGIIKPPLATVIAFFTSVGVAVGFAAQDLLKNIFGGLMILFDRPFQIGDKIEAGNSYGEVIKIGLRSTRIVTADDSVVTIPNGEMMNQSISNSNSGATNCQVVAELYLPLDIDTQKVRRIATEAALVSKYIYLNKPVTVLFFNEMKDRRSIIKMRLKAYVSDIKNEFIFKSDMTEITLRELIKEKLISPDYYQ